MKKKKRIVAISIIVLIGVVWFVALIGADNETPEEIIIKNENEALQRWGNRDVWGYLNLFTEDASYYDPNTKVKLNGYEAIKSYIVPWNGKIYVPSYKMVNIDVKVDGNIGVLTYNIYNFNEKGDTTELWNSKEIYEKIKDDWKILHSHWSIVKRK